MKIEARVDFVTTNHYSTNDCVRVFMDIFPSKAICEGNDLNELLDLAARKGSIILLSDDDAEEAKSTPTKTTSVIPELQETVSTIGANVNSW